MKHICPCSTESLEFERHGGVREDMRRSGFQAVFSLNGPIVWICGPCYDKAHEAAVKIVEIVKDEYLHFHGLMKAREQ